MSRKSQQIVIVVTASALYLAGTIYYAHVRPIDGDEGFYTTAARLVWEGKTPYRDFFYQQAPLLPYLYSWIWAIRPHSLLAMRTFSAACGGVAVLLWGLGLISLRRLPPKIALATFAVVALNPYWISWNVVVKTYAVSNLLMTVVMLSLYAAFESRRACWFFVAGLALGFCASVRSLYGPLIPVLALWLLNRELRGKIPDDGRPATPPIMESARSLVQRTRRTAALLSGAVAGLLPMLVSFARDPRAFMFNNVQYHHLDAGYLWAGDRFVAGYQSVGHAALVYFANIVVSLLGLHPYFTAELAIASVGAVALRRMNANDEAGSNRELLFLQATLLMLVTYTIVALIPFPPYDQYFDTPLVPLLTPFVAVGLQALWRAKRSWALALAALLPFFFMAGIKTERLGVTSKPEWRLDSYRRVTEVVKANSVSGDVVLSFWPGYVFESDRRYFPGLEDNFVYRIMSATTASEKARFHIVSLEQVMAGISGREASVLVIHPWIIEFNQNLSQPEIETFREAVAANYVLVSTTHGVEVYRRR